MSSHITATRGPVTPIQPCLRAPPHEGLPRDRLSTTRSLWGGISDVASAGGRTPRCIVVCISTEPPSVAAIVMGQFERVPCVPQGHQGLGQCDDQRTVRVQSLRLVGGFEGCVHRRPDPPWDGHETVLREPLDVGVALAPWAPLVLMG